MPALDFPASPQAGDKYPTPAVVGQPQYTFDGTKWTTVGAQITTAAPATAVPLMDQTVGLVGTATKYAREDHVHPSDTTKLSKSANLSDVANVVTARQSIYAAPFDALAYSGMQVNGSFEVSQEFGSVGANLTTSGSTFRLCDGWMVIVVQASGAFNFQASRTSNSGNQPGYENSAVIILTSGSFAAATSGDRLSLRQTIEGYRVSRLGWGYSNASPISYGFRFYSSVPGTIFVRVSNSASDRSYYQEQVVVAGWQWLSGTIPGDTTGTWLKDNSVGMQFEIYLGGKDTAPAVAGSWLAGTVKQQTTNSTNLMNAVNNSVYVTGVVILPGTEAPSAARSPLIMRPYDQELLTCKRYLWRWNLSGNDINVGVGQAYQATQVGGVHIPLRPEMRAQSTVTQSSPAHFNFSTAGGGNVTGVTLNWVGSANSIWLGTSVTTSGLTGGSAVIMAVNATAWLQADARL
jgi:hypothetical protein